MKIENIDIRYSQRCIAVKESYSNTGIYGTNDRQVNTTFCIDLNCRPCKACIFKGNTLVPIAIVKDTSIETIIRGNKGIYSRLDCVAMVVKLKGVFEPKFSQDGRIISIVWKECNIELFRPIGVSGDILTVTSINNENLRSDVKSVILRNIGCSIESKFSFIRGRV